MDERLSLRSLPHINTHAQSFFSPAVLKSDQHENFYHTLSLLVSYILF